jgi:hypothetical protein
MLGAGVIPIFRAGEKAIVAARRGMRMIMPVTLNLVIVLVFIAVDVCLHDLVIIRAPIVRAILCIDQRRGQSGHGESRTKRERFPKILAHIAFLVQGLIVAACYGRSKRAATPHGEHVVSAPAYA